MSARRVAPGIYATNPPQDLPAEIVHTDGHFPLRPGDEVTVVNLGRCRYTGKVNPDGSIDVFYKGRWRSVLISRIATVHRKERLR